MNCDEVRNHWQLYYDSEGDADLYNRINAHLGRCSECADWFQKQNRLERALEERLRDSPCTERLWQSVLERNGLLKTVPGKSNSWWGQLLVVVVVAAVLLVALGVWLSERPRKSAELARLTADYHTRLIAGRESIDFASESDLDVEDYLRGRVSFPVRCPPRKDSGFLVQGAGVRRLAGRETAYLVGQVEESRVSIFIFPRQALPRFSQMEPSEGQGVWHWRQEEYRMMMTEFDQNIVVIIGRTDPRKLVRVLDAYGSYPHGKQG